MIKKRVMVIDDDEKLVADIALMLETEGYTTAGFSSASAALQTLEAVQDIDLILTDINIPDTDVTHILKFAQEMKRPVPVIVFTSCADVNAALNIMNAGASDFLCKPISARELAIRIKKVIDKQGLADEVYLLRKRLESTESFHALVGKSKRMLEVYELISALSHTDSTVLIRGENGTGKELVARAIHNVNSRKDQPFVAISCTALQHTLLESELFGHEKGSFASASAQKTGKLENAGSGTVFLDEIGDTSLEIQAKLLRVLQERKFERIGSLKPLSMGARIIAATNMNLKEAVQDARFLEALYYRLNLVLIDIPPLRERPEDILLLAEHFLNIYKKKYDKTIEGFTPAACEQLLMHNWPGNIRELQNAVERTVITNPRRWIDKMRGLTP